MNNNSNKATESQKKLLIVLLMAVVFFAAYRFGYQPLTEETDQLAEENAALEREIADLKNKAVNEELYRAETEANRGKIAEILKKFGPGVTPEKSILFFIDLAQVAQTQIPTISFGEPTLVYTTSSLVNEEGIPYNQYSATYNVAYSTTYEGLKTLIAYVDQYPEKMNLNTLTAAYNSETDSLSGNFSIDWYMVTGTEKQYRFEDMEAIDIGNENIFRSGSGEGAGEGFDFNFDFGEIGKDSGTDADGTDGGQGTDGSGENVPDADISGVDGADDRQDAEGSGDGDVPDTDGADDRQETEGSGDGDVPDTDGADDRQGADGSEDGNVSDAYEADDGQGVDDSADESASDTDGADD